MDYENYNFYKSNDISRKIREAEIFQMTSVGHLWAQFQGYNTSLESWALPSAHLCAIICD